MTALDHLIPPAVRLASKVPGDLNLLGVSQSASSVIAGGLFFAIRGTKHDGHGFVEQALQNGAAAVVVEDRSVYERHEKTILVASTRKALAEAASAWYGHPTRRLGVVGVTGTNGKTTTTYLLKHIWDASSIPNGVLGTVEYHIGSKRFPSTLTTPDALGLQKLFSEMVSAGLHAAAIEVSSIALDQYRVGGSHFETAIFTNLTQDHLDYHGDFESYYQAKRRLFCEYPVKCAVINRDDSFGQRLLEETTVARKISFSLKEPAAEFFASSISFGKNGTEARLRTPEGEFLLASPLIGKHNVYNCLGVLAAIWAQGLKLSSAIEALRGANGAPGRLERVAIPGGQGPHVFVDYAHTDDALENVLKSLSELRTQGGGRLLTVFGCGGDRDKGKRPKMGKIASLYSDITIATSDNPRTEDPERILNDIESGIIHSRTQYLREVNRKKAIHLALSLAKPDDLVLIAGKGHETYQIIGKETYPFDDCQVVREYYEACTPGSP